jgi:competence ComEA-like helix-hairpin-helix protein
MDSRKMLVIGIASFIFIGGFFLSGMAAVQTKVPSKSPAKAAVPAKIDLNKATVEQIGKFPGLNPALAKSIVEYREKSGPFKSAEDLLKVKGVTKELLNKIKPKLDKNILYITPAVPSSGEDEEEPGLSPSKC